MVSPEAEEDDKDFGISISEDHTREVSTLALKNGLGEQNKERKHSTTTTAYLKGDQMED